MELGEISETVVVHKDRLVRFGFRWPKKFCLSHGTKIPVMNGQVPLSGGEIIKELILIHSCFPKHSLRFAQIQKKRSGGNGYKPMSPDKTMCRTISSRKPARSNRRSARCYRISAFTLQPRKSVFSSLSLAWTASRKAWANEGNGTSLWQKTIPVRTGCRTRFGSGRSRMSTRRLRSGCTSPWQGLVRRSAAGKEGRKPRNNLIFRCCVQQDESSCFCGEKPSRSQPLRFAWKGWMPFSCGCTGTYERSSEGSRELD
ncbi:hypothetical protein A7K93_07470 [Candidatus Methylacidiphilum fumarolicum]|nr:hypothetical protein A7K93_07470 [Candidatus Methylacidiphilum fumarolicum]